MYELIDDFAHKVQQTRVVLGLTIPHLKRLPFDRIQRGLI